MHLDRLAVEHPFGSLRHAVSESLCYDFARRSPSGRRLQKDFASEAHDDTRTRRITEDGHTAQPGASSHPSVSRPKHDAGSCASMWLTLPGVGC